MWPVGIAQTMGENDRKSDLPQPSRAASITRTDQQWFERVRQENGSEKDYLRDTRILIGARIVQR